MAASLDISEVLERYVSASSDPRKAYQEISGWIKERTAAGDWDTLSAILPRLIEAGLDYTTSMSLHRVMQRVKKGSSARNRRARIAILGSFTTHQLMSLLELYLYAGGVEAEFYEAEFGTFRQEILDSGSELYQFKPDFLILGTTWRDLGCRPVLGDDRETVARKVEAEVADWGRLHQTAHQRLGCQIIQNNFDAPPSRVLGNHETRHVAGLARYIALVNLALQDVAPPYVTVHDIDHLSAARGRWDWGDERFFHHAKLPCSPEHLVDFAHSLASLILAQLGVVRKCLVLDLDNTLWGGVIGDDGMGGIRLGQGDPESESYVAFQRFAKALGERGVILAVCSKNTDSVAREVFEKHPEMVLRLDDIACFMANWDDKATNLGRIAQQLNIGLNSLVFVDDNPAERAIIRKLRPEVAVPELPLDAAGYIFALERHRYFQPVSLSSEDLQRTSFYKADSAREVAQSSAEDLEGFLRMLDMTARIVPIEPATLERSVQLIHRSNQFNLTTRRHSNADMQSILNNASWLTRSISLRDRFGDNGLISVLLAKIEGNELWIDTWLMSCRVLKRGVEQALLSHLISASKERGLSAIRGEYIPSAKNGLVRDHYATLGFRPVDSDDSGRTTWILSLDESWVTPGNFIKES